MKHSSISLCQSNGPYTGKGKSYQTILFLFEISSRSTSSYSSYCYAIFSYQGNGMGQNIPKFEFTLCSPFFLFLTFDLTDFNFLFPSSFFVFRFRMEFWKRITIHFWFSVFGLWHWNWQSLFKRVYLGN